MFQITHNNSAVLHVSDNCMFASNSSTFPNVEKTHAFPDLTVVLNPANTVAKNATVGTMKPKRLSNLSAEPKLLTQLQVI